MHEVRSPPQQPASNLQSYVVCGETTACTTYTVRTAFVFQIPFRTENTQKRSKTHSSSEFGRVLVRYIYMNGSYDVDRVDDRKGHVRSSSASNISVGRSIGQNSNGVGARENLPSEREKNMNGLEAGSPFFCCSGNSVNLGSSSQQSRPLYRSSAYIYLRNS